MKVKVSHLGCQLECITSKKLPADFFYKWTLTTIFRRTNNLILIHLVKMWCEVWKLTGLKILFTQNPIQTKQIHTYVNGQWHPESMAPGRTELFGGLRYDFSSKNFFCYLRSFLRNTVGPEMTLPKYRDSEGLLHEGNVTRFISKVFFFMLSLAAEEK